MRNTLITTLVVLVFGSVTLVGWIGYQSFTTGFSAKAEPHKLEVLVARLVRYLAIPLQHRDKANPVPMSPEVLQEGLDHFADHCATCHANDGSGQTPIGKNVYPKAPDLRESATQTMSDGELFWVIHNGIRFTAMPAWGEGEPDQDVASWKLVHFIRHLPRLSQDELERMKSLNPKTKRELEQETSVHNVPQGHDAVDSHTGSGHRH